MMNYIVNDKKGRNIVNDRFGHKPDGLLLLYCNGKSYSKQKHKILKNKQKTQRINDKHQRKFWLSHSLLLDLNIT